MVETGTQGEHQTLEKQEDACLGVYLNLFSAKTPIEGQNGGVVTALLIKGLKESRFDTAIVVKRIQGYNAQAIVTNNYDEVLAAKGTKYLKVDVLSKLGELAEQGKRKIAITCTPCQARAAKQMEKKLKQRFPDLDITVFGLFCFEAFDAAKLKEEVKRVLNVDLDRAEQTEISKGKFIVYIEGQEFSCKIRELAPAAKKECHFCSDFTAQFADVSVGAVGSEKGFSTVIVRSAKGEELLKDFDAIQADVDVNEIVKLAKFKAQRAQKTNLDHKSQQ
jgi:coenzyme F420 hydrogenase subunit beta